MGLYRPIDQVHRLTKKKHPLHRLPLSTHPQLRDLHQPLRTTAHYSKIIQVMKQIKPRRNQPLHHRKCKLAQHR